MAVGLLYIDSQRTHTCASPFSLRK